MVVALFTLKRARTLERDLRWSDRMGGMTSCEFRHGSECKTLADEGCSGFLWQAHHQDSPLKNNSSDPYYSPRESPSDDKKASGSRVSIEGRSLGPIGSKTEGNREYFTT